MSTAQAMAIIPARIGAQRLIRKPLQSLAGIPLIAHVENRVRASGLFDAVFVATDDPEVMAAVQAHGGRAVLVDSPCASGTERVAKAAQGLTARWIVNVQGDEPFIDTASLAAVLGCLKAGAAIATLSAPLSPEDRHDRHTVKVVCDAQNQALYFSRAPIPGRQHLGVYGFTKAALAAVAFLPRGPLALAEDLEQLAWLEAGWPIAVAPVDQALLSIDTPQDLEHAERILQTEGAL